MIKIYSNYIPNKLLHIVNYLSDCKEERIDICDTDQYLQCAFLSLDRRKFRAHKHIPRIHSSDNYIAQESFVIIKGRVKCILYDLDDTILAEHIIGPGDISITFFGAHNYEILEDDTIIYEFKTGPYLGPEKDRIRL